MSDQDPEFRLAPETILEEGIPLPEDQQFRAGEVAQSVPITLEEGIPLASPKDVPVNQEPAPKGKSTKGS